MRCRSSIFTTGRDVSTFLNRAPDRDQKLGHVVSESVLKWILRSNLERKFRKMLAITPCHRKVESGPSNSFLSETWYYKSILVLLFLIYFVKRKPWYHLLCLRNPRDRFYRSSIVPYCPSGERPGYPHYLYPTHLTINHPFSPSYLHFLTW
jgi:hypothetical protein